MKKREDDMFEMLLKEAVSESLDKQIKDIENNYKNDEKYSFSKSHKKGISKLLKVPFYKTKTFKVAVKNIAVFFISFCIIFAMILSISPEARAFVKKVFVSWTDSVAIFSSSPENTKIKTEEIEIDKKASIKWAPRHIPDGYTKEFEEHSNIGTILYTSINDILIFEYSYTDGAIFVNNEDIEFNTLQNNNITYYLFAADKNSNKDNVIIWEYDNYRFSLNSTLDIEELKIIAFSVDKK